MRAISKSDQPRILLAAALLEAGQGGIARVARMTARALIRSGRDVDLVSYHDREPVCIDGRTAWVAQGRRLHFAAVCQRALMSHSHFVFDSLGIARARPRLPIAKRPVAVWMHGSEAWENLIAPDAASIRGADLVLVNSRYTLRRYERLYGPLAKAIVCPLATEADAPPTRRAQFEGQPKVLIVGRIDEREGRKGHARLLKVWPRVAAAVPNARLVIAGGGSGLAALRKMVASLSCGDLIDVLGFVPEEALQDLYSEAHVFAMPSQQEGFGIAYVEAMRHGLPVIASLQDAGQEVNIDGLTGYNVDLERDGELADRLIRLLQERDQAAAMGSAGFDHWTRNYRFAEFADRLLAILGPWLQERGTA